MNTILNARKVICLDRAGTTGTWVGIKDGLIAAVGRGDPPAAKQIVWTEGVVLPGMIDAHVHLTTTGMYRSGLDLRECRSVEKLLKAVESFVQTANSEWLIGGNFDPGRNTDARLPTRAELDRVSGSKVLVISRADGHSCAMNTLAFERLGLDLRLAGYEREEDGSPTGVLSNQANYEARTKFFSELPEHEIQLAQFEGCLEALRSGVTSVHEMASGGEKDIKVLLSHLEELPIHVRPYFSTTNVRRIVSLGLDCIGGDLFLDGSIGSRTAAMTEPYEDSDGSGFLYHSDEEITEFFTESSSAGLQAGVHAIGDAAIEQALRCIEQAASEAGMKQVVRQCHRIEHFECVSEGQIDRAGRLGVVASVQPMFDGYWGGNNGMYAMRLGERAATMNPFSRMVGAGMVVAGGSDSTVTPLNPFLGIGAAVGHKVKDFAVSVDQALRMFTIWGAYAGREESERGSIEAGKRADFCIVSEDPYLLDSDGLAGVQVVETWISGSPVEEITDGTDALHSRTKGA